MAVFAIRKFGDPVLREKCAPVTKIDDSAKELVKNLADTMYDAEGVGLAASQIGVLKRVVVIDLAANNKKNLITLINPEIIKVSQEQETDEEGCLSVPCVKVNIERPKKIEVKAQSLRGEEKALKAEGLLARVIQHEMDHLDGLLIIDRASEKERKEALEILNQEICPTNIEAPAL